ncbi:MAG: hypothetical protein ABI232_08290 [Jatrophihabitantaceae bacterium]
MAVLSALTACSSTTHGSDAAPTLAQAQTVLSRHATAVLQHSSADFLADVDTAPAAAKYRAAQAAMIDNITDVPLSGWTYTIAAPVTDPTEIAASVARYGRPTLLAQVTLAYTLTGIDPIPSPHGLWLTFVQQDGHVRIAGDDDVVGGGGTSWRGIWDFGPVVVARGTASLVLGHIQNAGQLTKIASVVDAAVPAVTSVVGSGWTQRVAVLVPTSVDEMTALTATATTGVVVDVSAVSVTDGEDPVSNEPYGQRLVLNPKGLTDLSTIGAQIVIRHEITHLATAAQTADTTPRWLVEGLAEYVGNLGSGQPVRTAAAELTALVAHGKVPAALPTDDALASASKGAAAAYEQAWLACRLIAARVGQVALMRFYDAVGTATAPPGPVMAAAMNGVLHESLSSFTAQWRAYLIAQLR